MAKNELQYPGDTYQGAIASVVNGQPYGIGLLTGVIDADTDANGNAVLLLRGVYNLSVKGVITGPANSAVAVGDQIYYNSGHTPTLDKDVGGVVFGVAEGTVGSGLTATIAVRLKG